MEWPKGAIWMVAIGSLGTIGTGVAYFSQSIGDFGDEVLSVGQEATENPAVPSGSSSPDPSSPEPSSAESTTLADSPQEPAQRVPETCRALVNVRVGGMQDDVYRYKVLDVVFEESGGISVSKGNGLGVYAESGIYTTQLGFQEARGVTHQVVEAFNYTAGGPADTALWQEPDHSQDASKNAGYILWPVTQQRVRIRSTIGEHVSVHRVLEDSEGGMNEESGASRAVKSGIRTRPLRLNMEALRSRPAAFSHQKAASAQGGDMIWRDFEPAQGEDFIVRLGNGPGKSVQPEVGICCYEREGTSKVVFAQLDRGAFALMAPGYLSRPDGYVRGGDGCGEVGWDGDELYARRRGEEQWSSLDGVFDDEPVQELLGLYWLPEDHVFETSKLVQGPQPPGGKELSRQAKNAALIGTQSFESGNYESALEKLRIAMRKKLILGESVSELRPMYDEAVLRAGNSAYASRYLGFRLRTAESPAEERRIRQLVQEIDEDVREDMGDVPGIPSP